MPNICRLHSIQLVQTLPFAAPRRPSLPHSWTPTGLLPLSNTLHDVRPLTRVLRCGCRPSAQRAGGDWDELRSAGITCYPHGFAVYVNWTCALFSQLRDPAGRRAMQQEWIKKNIPTFELAFQTRRAFLEAQIGRTNTDEALR